MKTKYLYIFIIAAIFWGCRQSQVQKEHTEKVIPVRVAPVEYGAVSNPIRSTGIVSTSEEIKLSFKTGGIVEQTYVDEGMKVKKGQDLAQLNTTEIKAQVAQAKSLYQKALRDLERAENLYEDSVATLEMKQNAETALNISKSVLEAAYFNLNHSKIKAPKSGIILKQIIRENELVAPGYPIYILGIHAENWILRTGLADRDMVKVQLGDSAKVTLDAWPGDKFTARVSQVAEVSDPITGTYEIELQLDPTDRHLATGFIAKLEILPAQQDSFYLIPIESLIEINNHEGYVFIPGPDHHATKIKVTLAMLVDGQAAISKGLADVDEVITAGSSYLKSGDLIKINR